MTSRENFLATIFKECDMQLSPKLILAIAVALAAPSAFAAVNGDSDNDWLMKQSVGSGSSAPHNQQGSPSSAG